MHSPDSFNKAQLRGTRHGIGIPHVSEYDNSPLETGVTSQDATFSCPSCGQQFEWQPQYAGRNLACACGQMMQVPVETVRPIHTEVESYDVKEERLLQNDEEPPPGKLSLDANGREVPSVAPAPVLNYRRATAVDVSDARDQFKSDLRNRWVPTTIIILGALLMIALALIINRGQPFGTALTRICLRIVWDIGITVLGGVALHWMTDGSLGAGNTPLLKLVALAIGRQTVWAIVGIPAGNVAADLIGFILSIPVFLFLFTYLFEECDFRDAVLGLVLISLMRWVSYFGLWKLL